MVRKFACFVIFCSLFVISAVSAQQNVTVISARDLKVRMHTDRRTVIIDARAVEEYRAGHIPGAINIPAEHMKAARGRLPQDRSAPLIFYCRGMS